MTFTVFLKNLLRQLENGSCWLQIFGIVAAPFQLYLLRWRWSWMCPPKKKTKELTAFCLGLQVVNFRLTRDMGWWFLCVVMICGGCGVLLCTLVERILIVSFGHEDLNIIKPKQRVKSPILGWGFFNQSMHLHSKTQGRGEGGVGRTLHHCPHCTLTEVDFKTGLK